MVPLAPQHEVCAQTWRLGPANAPDHQANWGQWAALGAE